MKIGGHGEENSARFRKTFTGIGPSELGKTVHLDPNLYKWL